MANVIERLRVQGNPAPRNLASQPDSGLRRGRGRGGRNGGGEDRDLAADQRTVQFVLNHSHDLQCRDTNSGRRMNQAARRLEHLHRVQHANQGLSSMDVRQPDLPGKQFLLRGKPASADTILHRHHYQHLHQQELTSQAGSSKSANARSTKILHADGVSNGALLQARSDLRDSMVNGNDTSNLSCPPSTSHMSTATSYFMLGNPTTLSNPSGNAWPTANKSRAGQHQLSTGSATAFELTGRQVVTPRSINSYEDGLSVRDFLRSPRSRSGFKDKPPSFRDRRSPGPGLREAAIDKPTAVDTQALRQCLQVQPSNNPESRTDTALKLKHYTQYTRPVEAKVNYNNPYRQTRPKERRALPESERRYIFDSVASYIHFNKIYPQMKDSTTTGHPNKTASQRTGFQGLSLTKDGTSRVPHLAGFPKHCTDTILLRMMFEMNRPGAVHGVGLGHQPAGAPSIRSSVSNKYSDIARHRDLDEFLVQGEAPVSVTGTHRQQNHQLSSQRSAGTMSHRGLPSTPLREKDEGGEGGREGQNEEEEDGSTLRTATTPGRRLPCDEDDEDADDEASQWNAKAGPRIRDGGGGARKRAGNRAELAARMAAVNGMEDTGYTTDTTTTDTARQ